MAGDPRRRVCGGLASVSPWSNAGVSATTFTVMTGVWLIVTQWLASGLGGYVTGRMRTKWVGLHTHEVFFRDTANGFLTWPVATVIGAVFLASAASSLVGGAASAVTSMATGAAAGASQGVTQSAGAPGRSMADPTGYFVDSLYRTDRPSANASDTDMRAQSTRILLNGIRNGDVPASDKSYLAQLVASRTGLSQADAEKRVDDVLAQEKAAELKARQAADATHKAGTDLSIFTALSMLVGAFIACAAAALGGQQRDEYLNNSVPRLAEIDQLSASDLSAPSAGEAGVEVKQPKRPKLLDIMGPGLITGASDDDPSGIATYSQAGAQFGYALGWTLLLSYPLMCAIQQISAQIGRVTGRGLAGNLRRHFPAWLLHGIIGLLLIANVINIGADLGAMGAALKLLVDGPLLLYVAAFAVLTVLLEVFVRYSRYVAILKWLTLSLFAYVATVFVVVCRGRRWASPWWCLISHSPATISLWWSQSWAPPLVPTCSSGRPEKRLKMKRNDPKRDR